MITLDSIAQVPLGLSMMRTPYELICPPPPPVEEVLFGSWRGGRAGFGLRAADWSVGAGFVPPRFVRTIKLYIYSYL